MKASLTDQNAEAFNNLFARACDRLENVVATEGYQPAGLGLGDQIKLEKSMRELERCLVLVPDHWQSLFFLGKAHQRLGDHAAALTLFEAALCLEEENHNLPREASVECLHLYDIDKALGYSAEALRRKPEDIGLLGNHAMNLLIAGRDIEASEAIHSALVLQPRDSINRNAQQLILQVLAGTAARPTCQTILPPTPRPSVLSFLWAQFKRKS